MPSTTTDQEAGTLASTVFEQLRRDIVSVQLAPGEKLRIEALRERYGVGGSPVREALNRLSAEGLVWQQDQKGFRVAPVSERELEELTRRVEHCRLETHPDFFDFFVEGCQFKPVESLECV